MKKINSIGYGGKILGCATIFTLVIPGIMQIIMFAYKSRILAACVKISFGIGISIIVFFIGLLAVEFHQDKRMNIYYETKKDEKLVLGRGLYECQACGNRGVKSEDKYCSVCGILFKEKDESNETNP
ncbi:hypothetical protein [Kineothrix sp. MB12-C1]|uniref:hypothetical protein n=1 Tax=Kineothrix sp. MB12-C1 TaxID=3070215 RepID=UPI0027D3332C|nr:hypothetical protein [Kineothrix sp. MB12-C1]WMC94107.1 hypothetical protein RBB56_07540 [Kineothrix sp. MB12-C1]